MRLRTIWTIDYMTTRERISRTIDWAAWEVAQRLPLGIRYRTTMIEIAKASRESMNIPATPLDVILKNLEAPKRMQ